MRSGCLRSGREERLGQCYSYRQFCSLGPLPPRTPARPDPQVPKDRKLGPCSHGKIGAFYFYAEGSQDDPAFGFCEIELSLQRLAENKVRLELYCIADGYQSARGVGARHPLKIAVLAGEDPGDLSTLENRTALEVIAAVVGGRRKEKGTGPGP